MKYILITGETTHNVKTETVCSIGLILKSSGVPITVTQINHTNTNLDSSDVEFAILEDGTCCFQNVGKYERFLDINLTKKHLISLEELQRENHIPCDGNLASKVNSLISEISTIQVSGKIPEVCIIDVNENPKDIIFQSIIQNFRRGDPQHFLHIHARTIGAEDGKGYLSEDNADMVVLKCFSNDLILGENFSKIFTYKDGTDILQLPQELVRQNVDIFIKRKFKIDNQDVLNLPQKYSDYCDLLSQQGTPIAVVGQFNAIRSYSAVLDSIQHSLIDSQQKVTIKKIIASDLEEDDNSEKFKTAWSALKSCRGIMVCGGNGRKGAEGRAVASKFARVNKIPHLGICYGMQFGVIEFARNVCGLESANTTELEPDSSEPLISRILDFQNKETENYGSKKVVIKSSDSLTRKLLGEEYLYQRHFNQFEFNKKYIDVLRKAGMNFVGFSADRNGVEIVEIQDHPFYIGIQFHPEYSSRFGAASRFYTELIMAAKEHS